jgi:hypothetical protein
MCPGAQRTGARLGQHNTSPCHQRCIIRPSSDAAKRQRTVRKLPGATRAPWQATAQGRMLESTTDSNMRPWAAALSKEQTFSSPCVGEEIRPSSFLPARAKIY